MKTLTKIQALMSDIEDEQREIRQALAFTGRPSGHTYVTLISDPRTQSRFKVFLSNEKTLRALREAYRQEEDTQTLRGDPQCKQ